jgi:hypothetical protein
MTEPDDKQLRGAFHALRAADQARVPAFDTTRLAPSPGATGRRSAGFYTAFAAAAAAAALGAVGFSVQHARHADMAVSAPMAARPAASAMSGETAEGAPTESTAAAQRLVADFERTLVSPSSILRYEVAIGLVPQQRTRILLEVEAEHIHTILLESDLRAARAQLGAVLANTPVDEGLSAAAAAKVTRIESAIAERELMTRVRTQNTLTPAQLARLRGLLESDPLGHRPAVP